jgi:hypothetical protein
MPIIRIIGRKSCTETRSKLLLVKNHDKLTGMDIILTSKCVENYLLSIEIDKTRKNSRLTAISSHFGVESSLGNCGPQYIMIRNIESYLI